MAESERLMRPFIAESLTRPNVVTNIVNKIEIATSTMCGSRLPRPDKAAGRERHANEML